MNRIYYLIGSVIGMSIYYILNYIIGYKLQGIISFIVFISLTTLGCIYVPKWLKRILGK